MKVLAKWPLTSTFHRVHADNYGVVRSIDHRLIAFLQNIQLKARIKQSFFFSLDHGFICPHVRIKYKSDSMAVFSYVRR